MSISIRARVTALWLAFLLTTALRANPQPASVAAHPDIAPIRSSAILQPALADAQSAISALNISRWKAPGEVKGEAQQNAASIQRDLSDTLPGLLTRADAEPNAVPPAFAVYRNLDALYDVMLRVYGTASIAAPQNEADSLLSALRRLESARAQLGDAILSSSQADEAQMVKLQAALKTATAAPPPSAPEKTSVIDDGPTPASSSKKKRKTSKSPANPTTTSAPNG